MQRWGPATGARVRLTNPAALSRSRIFQKRTFCFACIGARPHVARPASGAIGSGSRIACQSERGRTSFDHSTTARMSRAGFCDGCCAGGCGYWNISLDCPPSVKAEGYRRLFNSNTLSHNPPIRYDTHEKLTTTIILHQPINPINHYEHMTNPLRDTQATF